MRVDKQKKKEGMSAFPKRDGRSVKDSRKETGVTEKDSSAGVIKSSEERKKKTGRPESYKEGDKNP